jgi:hypothetical protein
MKRLILTDELRRAAERCVWFEPAEVAAADAPRLAAHILTYGAPEDVAALTSQLTEDDLRSLIDLAPPGVFDARSWAYWNLMVGRYETPFQPQRRFPDAH